LPTISRLISFRDIRSPASAFVGRLEQLAIKAIASSRGSIETVLSRQAGLISVSRGVAVPAHRQAPIIRHVMPSARNARMNTGSRFDTRRISYCLAPRFR
jgi:hypothetical protein